METNPKSAETNVCTIWVTDVSEDDERISGFKLKAIDIDNEHLGIPATEYDCTIQMPSAEFSRIVEDLAVMGETCIIKCDKDEVTFSVSRNLGVGNIMIQNNSSADKEGERVKVMMNKPVTLSFALRYLAIFTEAKPLSPTVTISMTPNNPVVVEYPMDTFGYVRYYLAPKTMDTER